MPYLTRLFVLLGLNVLPLRISLCPSTLFDSSTTIGLYVEEHSHDVPNCKSGIFDEFLRYLLTYTYTTDLCVDKVTADNKKYISDKPSEIFLGIVSSIAQQNTVVGKITCKISQSLGLITPRKSRLID